MTHPNHDAMSTTICEVLANPELDPVRDWRELISRVADHCVARTYADHGMGRERRWQGHYTRRVLEGVLDTTTPPIDWFHVQGLTQAALIETAAQSAILGAALVLTWPSSPAGLEDWPERAIALAGLRRDDGGMHISPIAGEVERRLRRSEKLAPSIRQVGIRQTREPWVDLPTALSSGMALPPVTILSHFGDGAAVGAE